MLGKPEGKSHEIPFNPMKNHHFPWGTPPFPEGNCFPSCHAVTEAAPRDNQFRPALDALVAVGREARWS